MTPAPDIASLCVGLDIGGTAIRLVGWRHGVCVAAKTVTTDSLSTGDPAERAGRLAGIIAGLVAGGAPIAAV